MKILAIFTLLLFAGGTPHKQECVYVGLKSTIISDLQKSGLDVDFRHQTWYVQQKAVAHTVAEDEPFILCW